MIEDKDLHASLVAIVADHVNSRGTPVAEVVAELDRVRALAPEIARRSTAETLRRFDTRTEEHPATRLERLFRIGCERGLRGNHAMDVAARQLAEWNAHPTGASDDLLEQLRRCADAIELQLDRRPS